jgi:hypothetical protein
MANLNGKPGRLKAFLGSLCRLPVYERSTMTDTTTSPNSPAQSHTTQSYSSQAHSPSANVAQCGPISALTLGLPASTAIRADKGMLPKQMFYAKAPVSSKLKQRFVNDIQAITMLALLRPSNTGLSDGSHINEVLIMGIEYTSGSAPIEVVEHIARLRKSGIIFVCVRNEHASNTDTDNRSRDASCTFAVRRPAPTKPGHPQEFIVYTSTEIRSPHAHLTIPGIDPSQASANAEATIADMASQSDNSSPTMDDLWNSLNAQVILDSLDGTDIDHRIAQRNQLNVLLSQEEKLAKDHARAKQPEQRNEIYTKLHKVRTQIEQLRAQR